MTWELIIDSWVECMLTAQAWTWTQTHRHSTWGHSHIDFYLLLITHGFLGIVDKMFYLKDFFFLGWIEGFSLVSFPFTLTGMMNIL